MPKFCFLVQITAVEPSCHLGSILGVVNTVFVGYMIYSTVSNPFYYGITPFVYVFTASVYVIPLATYLVSKRIRKSQGIDIDLLWKEIPPE